MVSKLWNYDHGYEKAKKSFQNLWTGLAWTIWTCI